MNDFEELANELNKDSTSIGKIIFIIAIIIGIGILIFLGVKTFFTKEEKKEEKEVTFQSTDFDCYDKCDYHFKIGEQDILVNYEKTLNDQEDYVHKITLNGKEILNQTLACGAPIKLILLNDVFVFQYRNGCDDIQDTLRAYDKDGKMLFEYGSVDEEYPMLKLRNTLLSIQGNTLSFRATSIKNNTTLVTSDKEYDICDASALEENDITTFDVVEATYEIRYQGNNSFEKPIRKSSLNLEKYKELYNVNDICNVK